MNKKDKKKMREAMNAIIEICQGQRICDGCPFDWQCHAIEQVTGALPEDWDLIKKEENADA